ncbi:hypothetical protein QAD02_001433 [Eretmocerus hayati]|uniref:Uncharacterized protein n=1 Tax=Eretmocerus hayati TaxID=131215 RepID=A0ACC2NIL9_9HYME|nr:hypothetical protein QAD02_001433 [Eretmocerus hayati]
MKETPSEREFLLNSKSIKRVETEVFLKKIERARDDRKETRRLDKSKLGDIVSSLPNDEIRDSFVLKMKPSRSSSVGGGHRRTRMIPYVLKPFPTHLKNLIVRVGLLDVVDVENEARQTERRVDLMLGAFRANGCSLNTTRSYMTILKAHGLFGTRYTDPNVNLPVRLELGVWSTERVHDRVVAEADYSKFVRYVLENPSKYVAPLYVAITAALRPSEILKITNDSLRGLIKRSSVIRDVTRKSTSLYKKKSPVWNVVYYNEFRICVRVLQNLYADELESPVTVRLFPISLSSLNRRFRTILERVTGVVPNRGVGVHVCRYILGMSMNKHGAPLKQIQRFLGHGSGSTTEKYIQRDFSAAEARLNRMFEKEFE